MTFELLVNALARGALGLLSAIVLSFLFWRLTEVMFDLSDSSLGLQFLVQSLIVGFAAAVPTVFAWWNTQSKRRIQLVYVVVTLGTAVAGAWLVNEIRGVETYYALFGGVTRLQVFSRTHMFVSMIFGAVIGANVVAAAFYIYRAMRYREN